MHDSSRPQPHAPFGTAGVWLRCNFHAHTTESDGMLTPPMLRRYYALGGYDALAITDHDRVTELPEASGAADEPKHPLLLPGTELSLRAPVSGGPLHVVGVGVRTPPRLPARPALGDAVAAIDDSGGVAILAHPWWSGLRPEELDPAALAGCVALEVFNAGCEVEQGRGNSAQYWDALLAADVRVNAVATDDHHMPGFDAFRAWTMVRAAARTPDAIVDALRAGAFYSTTGPAILALTLDDDGVTVETTPARSIAALGQPPVGARLNAGAHALQLWGAAGEQATGWRQGALDGDLLTRARFPRLPGWRYLRIEVADERGRMAWSNPVWLDE